MIARRIHIEGKVQGVFFRDWTVETARQIGVSGWVRNRRDGAVEVLAIGAPEAVEALVAELRQGSPASRVARVSVEETEPEAVDGFSRAPTA